MKRFLILALLLAPSAALARPHVHSDAAFAKQRAMADNALEWLSVDDSDWSIFVISKRDWQAALTKEQLSHTQGSCFTVRKLTFCNADYINSHSPIELARILAHEYGHVVCACTDEGTAESYVETLFHRR